MLVMPLLPNTDSCMSVQRSKNTAPLLRRRWSNHAVFQPTSKLVSLSALYGATFAMRLLPPGRKPVE